MIQQPLIAAIREFTGAILNPFDLEELLHRLTGHATTVLEAAGAGLMLADDQHKLAFVAASDERVRQAELHQEEVSAGTCHEAYSINEIVTVNDLRADRRWPEYSHRVAGLGLRAVIGVPLNAHAQTIGVMNVYREQAGEWTEDDISALEILAAMGAGYIVNGNQLRAQHTLAEQLRLALETRDVIGQAKGILMARANVDADGAFAILRERSQTSNRKLRDVASAIVENHSGLEVMAQE